MAIAVSSFCEATVQAPPFIARGNGGSGLIVLEPRQTMTAHQLAYIAAYINTTIRWRFNWYHQATVDRIRRFEIPDPANPPIRYRVQDLLPDCAAGRARTSKRLKFRPFRLDSLFILSSGEYHSAAEMPAGDTPLVSCGDQNNGIMGFVTVPEENIHTHQLTIAFNGMNTLTTKFHPYAFAAKDDIAVCTPRKPLRASTLFFIQVMMAREQWRYNFYRKCFMDKLERQSVELPANCDKLDEDGIQSVVDTCRYWAFLEPKFAVPNLRQKPGELFAVS